MLEIVMYHAKKGFPSNIPKDPIIDHWHIHSEKKPSSPFLPASTVFVGIKTNIILHRIQLELAYSRTNKIHQTRKNNNLL